MPAPGRVAVLTLLVLLAAVTTPGCADMALTRTGFLSSYERLQAAPERTVSGVPDEILFYEKAGVDWSATTRVYVEPVAYVPATDVHVVLTPAEQASLTSTFGMLLRKELGEVVELVDAAGPDTVTVRAAITDVETETPWINWVMVVLLVPSSLGGISGEMEIVDSTTGEQLAALVATREGTPFLVLECFSRFGHAEHSMGKWAVELRRMLRPDAN